MHTAPPLQDARARTASRDGARRPCVQAALWTLAWLAFAGAWLELAGNEVPALVVLTAAVVFVLALRTATRLDQRTAQLRQRERQLADIIDTATDAILTVDARQRIVLFNRAAARVFRLPPEAALGQPLERFVPERLRAAHHRQLERFAATGVRASPRHLLTGLRADGEEFPLHASMSRLGHGDGALLTVVVRDATEEQAAERARHAQAAAEAASRAKTEFLARVSHELRTPLNAMLGFSQLLLAQPDPPLPAEQARQARHIVDAGWHLLALVNDLLDVARIESGALRLDCHPVDLGELVDESWRLVEKEAQRHGVALEAAYRDRAAGAAPVTAWGDPLRLRQVLVNLLSNAVKYNRAEGRVRVDLACATGSVVLEIADTGLGMSAEQLAHLYEPFNRLGQEHGGIEGAGIGLALSRQLVTAMEGELQVLSRPGQGTRVRLRLRAG